MNIIERDEQVVMANERLADVPQFAMPARYGLRWYQPGDVDTWVDMHRGIHDQIKVDSALFVREYGDDEERLATCMAFLLNPWKEPIGTITAWADDKFNNAEYGRIHWVVIVPEEQGKGLSKPMMSAACQRLLKLGHERAYLVTSTGCVPAINMYRQFGFVPMIKEGSDQLQYWRELAPHLKSPMAL